MLKRYQFSPHFNPHHFAPTPSVSSGQIPMAVIRWRPRTEMETLRRQLNQRQLNRRQLNQTRNQMCDDAVPTSQDQPLTHRKADAWAPAIELNLNESEIVLRAELPGINAKDLDIQVTRAAISISGESKPTPKNEESTIVRSEFRQGRFHRIVPLPVEVRNDQTKAEFKDGILTLTLPKLERDRPNVVKLNLANTATEQAAQPDEIEDVWAE